jgi:RHS repeat-associated protein
MVRFGMASMEISTSRRLTGAAALLTMAIALLMPIATASATVLPEKITENMTLTAAGNPYTGSPIIEPGVTVKVEAGVRAEVNALGVKGTLLVEGTASEPVVFTGPKEAKGGEWCAIAFRSGSSASVINHAEIKYGGACGTGNVLVEGVSPTIESSTISHSSTYGINIPAGGGPEIADNSIFANANTNIRYVAEGTQTGEINIHGNTIEGGPQGIYVGLFGTGSIFGKNLGANTITGTTEKALYFNGTDIPGNITGNTLSSNKDNIIRIGGTVSHSETWNNGGSPVLVESPITVASGVTLTITKGVRLMNPETEVKGTLLVEGTISEPVVFTGAKEAAGGEWCAIHFAPGSGASVVDHAEVKYGGACGTGNIYVDGASPTIEHSVVSHSSNYGVNIPAGGGPELFSNAFLVNADANIRYSATGTQTGQVNIHGNAIEGGPKGIWISHSGTGTVVGKALGENTIVNTTERALYYSGGDIPGDITGNLLAGNADNVIRIGGTVAHSEIWTDGGVPVRFEGGVTVASGATLTIAKGVLLLNPTTEVKGTLLVEGTAKEPVVFTGAKGAAGGEWCAIAFRSGSGASVVDHAEIKYGGACGTGNIYVDGAAPTIRNSTLARSSTYGIRVDSGSPNIEWNRFRGNANNGVYYGGAGTLSAQNNDWSCGSGPSPAGCGDSVSSNVKWQPAVSLPEPDGSCRGDESQCGRGGDPVSLATGQLSYMHRDLLLTNKSRNPLEFARAYSSGSGQDTGLGPGWSQTGLASATELESGEVLVVRQDGRQDLFQKTETGYKAPSGVTETLAKVEGTFQLTTLENTVYRFDSSGRIASVADDHGLKTVYAYNPNGRLATITDPSAQTLNFSYNASNHITLVADSTGREVKFAYSAAGDLETVTDALGGVTKYGYDSQHRLTTITDPRSNVILKNVYNGEGKISEQEDGLGNLWKLEYGPGETTLTEPEGGELTYGFDSQKRVVSEIDQLGHTTATSYDAAGNVSEVLRPGGAKWSFGHDSSGNLTSVEDPEGGQREYEYDAKNRLTKFTDARGNSWSYEWSAANDLTKVTDPEGGEATLTYNASGQPLTAIDPNSHESEFSYDTRGNRLSATDPLGHKTSFEYDARNYLTAKTLPGLKAESFERNALGDLLARTTPEGHKTKYAYDANGLPTQVTDPDEGIWKIERNAMERPTAYVDPLGQEAKVSYDGNLKPIKLVDRRGSETSYDYDLANQLIEVDRPEGESWEFGYDSRGNRSSMVDPRGNETTYAYDLLNRMIEADEPLAVVTEYGYDAGGNLTSVTDPRGNTTGYDYDKLGRLTEIAQPLEKKTNFTYDSASNELTRTTAAGSLEYGYDAANRLVSIEGEEATLRSFGYDPAGRLVAATDAEGHEIEVGHNEDGLVSSIDDGRGQSLTRSYDPRGLLTKQVDARGTLEYGYDKLGRMSSLIDPQGKPLGFAYDPEGDLTEVTRPNGVTTTNVYDGAGRLSETTSKAAEPLTLLEGLNYEYDLAGNVTSKLDQRLEQKTTYAYDALNRLTELDPPGEAATVYAYDAAGNRTEAGGTTYSFNALNQLTEDSTGTTYGYDGAGRLTSEVQESEETAYSWDLFDHLAKVEGASGTVTYSFDGLERLSERKAGESTEVFHYGDLGDMPSFKTAGEGEPTTSYFQGPRGLVEQRSGEATAFPLIDGHGDVTAISTAAGEVESRQTFDPWGAQLSGPSLEMGYLGAWERPSEPATSLIQMGARSYAPSLGSFATEDPVLGHIGIGVSGNRYPYSWNNPVNRYDLDGRDALPIRIICFFCTEDEQDRAGDFFKAAKDKIQDIHIGGERECEKEFIASSNPFFPCEEIEGELEYKDSETTVITPRPYIPKGPNGSVGDIRGVPAWPRTPALEPVYPYVP